MLRFATMWCGGPNRVAGDRRLPAPGGIERFKIIKASIFTALLVTVTIPALADGGQGGGSAGGVGGTGFTGNPGSPGAQSSGGGGGGAGGGDGGNGGSFTVPGGGGIGGLGGTVADPNGQPGGDASTLNGSAGGGGGGGGYNGNVAGAVVLFNNTPLVGGSGGTGGLGTPPVIAGGGGGGGAGGFGALVTVSGVSRNFSSITAGVGGAGGSGAIGGSGGDGGIGTELTSRGATLDNSGTLAGGTGGNGGPGNGIATGGAGGLGGVGVNFGGFGGALNNSGSVAGGNGGTGGLGGLSQLGGSGGQGGGGGAGVIGNSLTVNNSGAVTGGKGAAGGFTDSVFAPHPNGGQGGSGILGTGLAVTNAGSITGGDGGQGGDSFRGGPGGNGGAGGFGILGSDLRVANFGTIKGGDGGPPGINSQGPILGNPGSAGNAITGSDLIVTNGGTIVGGVSGDGVTRANAISFTGGTNVLELQAGSAITGNVLAFSSVDTFRLGGTSKASFDVSQLGAQYQGFGDLEKTGNSIWTLVGAETVATPWTINAGTLVVNGSISNSAATVNSGATLSGSGTVGTLTVKSGGTFAPGPVGAPGSMTVVGNLAFQSGALYVVQVTPSLSSSANVIAGGTAMLAGTVEALFASGTYITKNYTILTAAGGRSGTFDNLATSNLPAGFAASLSYTASDAILNLTATLGLLPTGTLTQNQLKVANGLNNFFNSGGVLPAGFVNVFGLTGANLGSALTLLSGETATGVQQGSFELMNEFLGVMMDPFVDGRSGIGGDNSLGDAALAFAPQRNVAVTSDLALAYGKVLKAQMIQALPFEQRWKVWGTAYGGYSRTSGDPVGLGSHDLTARAGGFAAGMDYRIRPDTTVGFALAGGGAGWSTSGLGSGHSDAFQVGAYGTHRFGSAYVSGALAYTAQWASTDRMSFAAGHLTARFMPEGVGARIESGYRFMTPLAGITPYIALQAQTLHIPASNEADLSTGSFGLNYASRNPSDTRSELGARLDKQSTLGNGTPWVLRARAAWAHDWVSDPTAAASFQSLPGSSFLVTGAIPAKDSILLSAGSELKIIRAVTLGAKFDSQLAPRSQTYAATATLRMSW